MTTAIKPEIHQVHARNYIKDLTRAIDSNTRFPTAVSNLVAQYLAYIPATQGWNTTWADDLGREVCTRTIRAVEFHPLNYIPSDLMPEKPVDLVKLVVEYLQWEMFGLKDVEEAAGGKEELAKLLPGYGPEHPLPSKIDDLIQADLASIFSPKALEGITARKVAELFSLYWCPKVTANIAEQIAKKHGQKFYEYSYEPVLKEHRNARTSEECWMLFPNDVFGRNKSVQEQKSLIPEGFEFPRFPVASFCVFIKYARTKTFIMFDKPWTYTRCQEETEGYKVDVGGFGARGLHVSHSFFDRVLIGVALVRKFC
ncbi:MAG: hypothetical protein ACHQT8_02105 [Chlamydiales bacterium]